MNRFTLGAVVVLAASATSRAQLVPLPAAEEFALQGDATTSRSPQAPGTLATGHNASAGISGLVRNSEGSAVPSLPVTLLKQDTGEQRVTSTDENGNFTFSGLPSGTYKVEINAPGFQPSSSPTLTLEKGETRELSLAVTTLAKQTTTVNVVATTNEVAQAQVHEQEKQRVLGFIPNYYTSYIWNAAPLTPQLKFQLASRSTFDPVTFIVSAGVAGVEQWHNTYPGYGQGAEGYGKRFGSSYGDTVANRILGTALFPALLHQDPRYFYKGSGSVRSRILYALAAGFICRGDNGKLQPNYSQWLGNLTAAGLSNAYRSPGDRTAGLTFRDAAVITASGAVVNVLREFLSRKLTPNVPSFANGESTTHAHDR